jgi:hypothetical protein
LAPEKEIREEEEGIEEEKENLPVFCGAFSSSSSFSVHSSFSISGETMKRSSFPPKSPRRRINREKHEND